MAALEERQTELIFPDLSPQEICDNIGAEERGRADGQNNIPGPQALQPSTTEAQIADHFESKVRDTSSAALSVLGDLRAQRRELDLESALSALRQLPSEFDNAASHLRERHRAHHDDLRERERKLRGNLQTFMSENRLNHEARPKENPATFWIIIVMVVVLETALNATFFSLGSELGYLGGIIQAAVISIINVGVAILCGLFGAPQINHIKFVKKMIGGLSVLIWITVAIVLNVFAAHYRSELEQDPFQAVTAAVDSIKESFWGIESAQGWLLLGVGLFFSVAVLLKVYSSDDPYPGYSKSFAAHRRARENWNKAQTAFVDSVKELHAEFERKLAERMTEALRILSKFEGSLQSSKTIVHQFKDYQHRASACCQQVVGLYRHANMAVRQDPAPGLFEEKVLLDFSQIVVPAELDDEEVELEHMKTLVSGFKENETGVVRQQLNVNNRRELDSLAGYFQGTKSQPTKQKTEAPESPAREEQVVSLASSATPQAS